MYPTGKPPPQIQKYNACQLKPGPVHDRWQKHALLRANRDYHSMQKSRVEKSVAPGRSTWGLKGISPSLKGFLHRVLESGDYSDLTITCGDEKFSVHKVVVCSQSKVLAAAMKKGFKESELNTIDLSEDGSLVSHLVNFLYTGDYPTQADTNYVEDPSTADNAKNTSRDLDTNAYTESMKLFDRFLAMPESEAFSASSINMLPQTLTEPDHHPPKAASSSEPSPPDYSVHVEMYALADKYDIPTLGTLAQAKFDHTYTANWHPTSFLETIPRVYDSTLESNQGLRLVVLDHIHKHSRGFMADKILREKICALFTAIPEFKLRLLCTYIAMPDDRSRRALCRTCGPNVPTKVLEEWYCGKCYFFILPGDGPGEFDM